MKIKKSDLKKIKKVITSAFLAFLLILCALLFYHLFMRVKTERNVFQESSKEIRNPNRGFYCIYQFSINDDSVNYQQIVSERYQNDVDTKLSLIEVNLQEYTAGSISEKGLANIDKLFQALERIDKQLIVRFLYDWDGENERVEPQNIDIVLTHMEQLGAIIKKYQQQIFTMQGLFVGNWGEMNGSKYLSDECIQKLADKLYDVTDGSTYLSVRMPKQWRTITNIKNPYAESLAGNPLAERMGLFNDGMLGNESDYGTYGDLSAVEAGRNAAWNREDELSFQEKLCRSVPNGGEVINDNEFNDFESAVKDLAQMHVTYLNMSYDQNVLNKWEKTLVSKKGCFNGMDGLAYIKRHLGYRLLISQADLSYNFWKNNVSVKVKFKNAGFAPLYKEPAVRLVVYNEETDNWISYDMEGSLRGLPGGNDAERTITLQADIPVKELTSGRSKAYISIEDLDTGESIMLANEQEEQSHGYWIGTIIVK